MQKKLLVIALGVALSVAAGNSTAFGLKNLTDSVTGGSSSGSADVGGQVNKFQSSALLSNELMANSSVYLLRAISSKERGAELQKQLDTINQISDPKEKNAELAKLVESSSAELATKEKDQQTKDQLKKASSAKKKAIASGLFNLSLSLLKVNDLTKSGNGIISGVGKNPADALKVVPVKDTLPVLSALASNGKNLLDTSMRLAKSADIKVEAPATAEVAPQKLDDNAFN